MDATSRTASRRRPVVTYSKKSRTFLEDDGENNGSSKRRRLFTTRDAAIQEPSEDDPRDAILKSDLVDRSSESVGEVDTTLETPDDDVNEKSESLDSATDISLKPDATATTILKSTSAFVISTRRKPLFKRHAVKPATKHEISKESSLSLSISDKTISSCTFQVTKTTKLVQMQIDLDGSGAPKITCKECKMQYVPSAAEDAKLHKKYHAKVVEGLNFGGSDRSHGVVWEGRMMTPKSTTDNKGRSPSDRKVSGRLEGAAEKENSAAVPITKYFTFGRGEKQVKKIPLAERNSTPSRSPNGNGPANLCQVLEVSRKSPVSERKKAVEFLKFANRELSAQDVPEKILWGSSEHDQKDAGDRFKIYLYLDGSKCVGLCLAESIKEAQWATTKDDIKDGTGSISCSLQTSPEKRSALLGISRIWTNPKYRRHGIASRLVTSAAESFVYGMKLSTDHIAFSQPTDSGAWFSLGWIKAQQQQQQEVAERAVQDEKHGFLVYFDSV